MSWSQSDLDALDNAIKKGVRSVSYATGSVTYHSLAEMLRLRDVMKGEVSGGGRANVTRTVGVYDGGLSGGPQFPDWRRR